MVQVCVYSLLKQRGTHSRGHIACGRHRGGGVGGREGKASGVFVEFLRDMWRFLEVDWSSVNKIERRL